METQNKETQEERLKVLRFEVKNARSSRCHEQRLKAKLLGIRNGRKVKVQGVHLRPGRSRFFSAKDLTDKGLFAELSHLESQGLIVVCFDGQDINLAQALLMCAGQEKPKGPFFETTIAGGSDGLGGAELRIIKTPRDTPFVAEEEKDDVEDASLEEVEMVSEEVPESPEEIEVEEDFDLEGLEFIAEATQDTQTGMVEIEEEYFTVKEAASFTGKSQTWIRKAIKNGTIEKHGTNPVTIAYSELQKVLIDQDEPEE